MNVTLLALYNVYSYGIRGLHAWLEKQGYSVKTVFFKNCIYSDGLYTDLELQGLVELLQYTKPDIIAIGVHSPLFPLFVTVSKLIRARFPKCKIIAGGDHPTVDPHSCTPYADYVVMGEGEKALTDIIDGYVDEGIVGPYLLIEDLDSFPFPHYGLGCYYYNSDLALDNQRVYGDTFAWFASIGCQNNCTYCHECARKRAIESIKPKVRVKSVDYLVEQLMRARTIFPGTTSVLFSDAIFPYDIDWLADFASLYRRMLGLPFTCQANASLMTEDALKLLKEAGARILKFGVQSASQHIRKEIYERADELEDILNIAHKANSLGISTEFDFITNSPYDTAETLKETRNFIDKLPWLSQINQFELRFFPGTLLTERALEEGLIEPKDIEGQYLRIGHWSHGYRKT